MSLVLESFSQADKVEESKVECIFILKSDKKQLQIEDAEKINKDPDTFIETLSTDQLKQLRDTASTLYYNLGTSGITDNSFDALEWHLRKRLKKEFEKTVQIGSLPIQKLRVDLPYPMASLNKVHPEDSIYFNYIRNIPDDGLVWSDKLDGVSGQVVYRNGKPAELYTRGDGSIGGNVSYLLDHLDKSNFPVIDYERTFVVRGEFVIKRQTFQEKYKDIFTNSRSFVVSQINKGYITEMVKDLDFVSYEIVYFSDEYKLRPEKCFKLLKKYKFNVVSWGFMETVRMMDITLQYDDRRKNSEYDIDGLVLDYNNKRKIEPNDANPINKVAFKMSFKEMLRDTEVVGVEWDISKHGRYNPVCIYKPVYINHVRISRATAHNAAHIRDWHMGKGTKIKVTRSGDVIPQVKDVEIDKSIEPIYPDNYSWHWKGRDIVLDDIENNPIVQQKRILYFFKTLKVPRIGEKTVEYMYDAGFDTIKKIVQASSKDLTKVKRMGIKTADTIKDGIRNGLSTTSIDYLIKAFTVTGFRVSHILVKEVIRTFPDIFDEPRDVKEMEKILKSKKIKGIGPARIKSLSENLSTFRNMIIDLDEECFMKAIENQKKMYEDLKQNGYDDKIKGKSFVFSGFGSNVPYQLQDKIFNNYGEIKSSVNSRTDILVVNTASFITSKVVSAKENGVPIYTLKEFEEYLSI